MSTPLFFVFLQNHSIPRNEMSDSTTFRQDLKGRIVDMASDLFCSHGIKSVKMDDIAKRLSISKRTLYEIFATKEALLSDVVLLMEQKKRDFLKEVYENSADVIEVVVGFYQIQMKGFMEVNPDFFLDLRKYPKLINSLRHNKRERRASALSFIERGVKEGFFREDMNYKIVQELADSMGGYVMSSNMYKEYAAVDVFQNLTLILLRGICTVKGIEKLDSFLKKLNL